MNSNEVDLHMQLVELEVVYHQRSMEALQRIIPQLQQSIGLSVCLSVCLPVWLSAMTMSGWLSNECVDMSSKWLAMFC